MFSNIGRKIQVTGKVFCWIGIALGLVGAVVAWFSLYEATRNMGLAIAAGILVAVISALLSWIGSFHVIGFGKLVENSEIIASNMTKYSD